MHQDADPIIISETNSIDNCRTRENNTLSVLRRSYTAVLGHRLSLFRETMHVKLVEEIARIRQNHAYSTIAFCMCIFAHTYLSNSLLPYAGFMAIQLLDVDEETAGRPGGFLYSTFLMGRALSSYHWGKLADLYGWKFTIILSFGLSSIFSLAFGFSTTWTWAILSRFLCGLCGGVTGVITTAISEVSHGDADLETKGFGLFAGRWSWGLMVAPGIGGMLAEPFGQYPILLTIIPENSIVYKSLNAVPFALPNILGALLCWTSMLGIAIACDESLVPSSSLHKREAHFLAEFAHCLCTLFRSPIIFFQRLIGRPSPTAVTTTSENTKLIETRAGYMAYSLGSSNDAILETDEDATMPSTKEGDFFSTEDTFSEDEMEILSYIEFPGLSKSVQWRNTANVDTSKAPVEKLDSSPLRTVAVASQEEERKELLPTKQEFATMKSIWANKPSRQHLIVFWIYGFVSVLVEGAFPLYCMSVSGGLGISEARVGAILSLAGTFINFCQFPVYMFLVNSLGLHKGMMLGSFVSVVLLAFIPLSVPLNEYTAHDDEQQLTASAFLFLVVVLAASRVFSSSVDASLLVSMHRTVFPYQRSTMNSLSALFASLGRAFGPLFAGSLVSHCFFFSPPRTGGVIIWIVLALCGVASCTVFMTLINNNVDEGDSSDTAMTTTNSGHKGNKT